MVVECHTFCKDTVYAVHHTLEHVAQAVDKGRQVLLFIDEINRAEHAGTTGLMNLILNREINGFSLSDPSAYHRRYEP